MRAAAASLIAIGLSLAPSASEARPFRVGEIPNGGRLGCETCHETEGGVIFNPFGSDARSALVGDGAASEKSVDWAQLAGRDSDGDGFTNGQELLDPEGTWRSGMPNPPGTPSAPGDPASLPTSGACGDGLLTAAETCDGAELRDQTCESQNLGGGELRCGADCRLDTSGCTGEIVEDDAGDEAIEEGGCAASGGVGTPRSAPLTLVLVALAFRSRRRSRQQQVGQRVG
jgi:hypothetical protein